MKNPEKKNVMTSFSTIQPSLSKLGLYKLAFRPPLKTYFKAKKHSFGYVIILFWSILLRYMKVRTKVARVAFFSKLYLVEVLPYIKIWKDFNYSQYVT